MNTEQKSLFPFFCVLVVLFLAYFHSPKCDWEIKHSYASGVIVKKGEQISPASSLANTAALAPTEVKVEKKILTPQENSPTKSNMLDWSFLLHPINLLAAFVVVLYKIIEQVGTVFKTQLCFLWKKHRNVLLWVSLFFTMGACCYLLQGMLNPGDEFKITFDENGVSSLTKLTAQHPVAELLGALGSSFIVTGLFSVLLGLVDFVTYVSSHLKEVIMEHDYLNKMGYDDKLLLRKKIDQSIFGTDTVKAQSGLYDFISRYNQSALSTAYRTNLNDKYDYYELKGNSSAWRVVSQTSYSLQFEHMKSEHYPRDTDQKVFVPFFQQSIFPSDQTKFPKGLFSDLKVSIEDVVFRLPDDAEDTLKQLFEGNKDVSETIPLKPNVTADWIQGSPSVTFELSRQSEHHHRRLRYHFKIPIVVSRTKSDKLLVKIHSEKLVMKNDRHLMLSMSLPTKNTNLSCTIHSETNYKFFGSTFCIDDKLTEDLLLNTGTIAVYDWMVEGHGMALSWAPEEDYLTSEPIVTS